MPWDHRRAGLGGGAVGHREDDGRAAADDDDDVDQKFRQHFRQLFLARFTLDSIRFDSGFSLTFELFFPPSDREILFYDLTSIFMENFQFYRRTFKLNCSPLLFWKEPFKMLFSFFLSY